MRSMATLLVMEEEDDVTTITNPVPSSPLTNGFPATKGTPSVKDDPDDVPKIANSAPSSPTTNGFPLRSSETSEPPESLVVDAEDMDDSVFGDVPLDDHPVRFQVTVSDADSQLADDSSNKTDSPKLSSLRRQGSLRSQVSA